ncbi:MAG: spondin domain-containing protein [Bacteroidetes bacterium]|nr:spondin domain-containing protein [Bacteroidota bacterium]
MKNQFKIIALSVFVAFFGCSSSDDTPSGNGGGDDLVIEATYKVTFEPIFTEELHPIDYPANAGFSKVFLLVHSNTSSVFTLGDTASAGLKLYAEEGNSSILVTEHTQTEDNVNPTTIVLGTSDVGPTEPVVFTITITPSKLLISFVTKISPSPDWFLGVDSFSLENSDNTLVESVSIGLFALDAGTDAGETYTSANSPELSVISIRTGLPLWTNPNETGKGLGVLKIERINTN